jgi:TRAP-type C4-dicarboxylate transport system permease small subunit
MAGRVGCGLVSTWFDRCLNALALIGAAIVVFVTLAMSCDAIARYFFGFSMAWVYNMSQHLLLYVVFLSAAWVLREGAHVSIDLIEERLSERRGYFLRLTTSFLSMLACAVLCWSGSKATLQSFRWGTIFPGPPAVYEYLVMAIVPVGSFLLIIQFGRNCWGYTNRLRRRS